MKNIFKKISLLGIALTVFTFTSCSDDETTPNPGDPKPVQESIAAIASKNSNLSSLVAALKKADLVTTLSNAGTYTVFAPTNEAFSKFLAANKFATLDDVPVELLKEVLLNHVLSTENFSNKLTTGYVKTLGKGKASKDNALSMYVNIANGVRLNGVSSVSQPDIDASNGVIHVVDAVIGLPTVVTHASANANFSSLVSALTREGNTTNFVAALSGTGPFTVFAPTNEAFGSVLTELKFANLAAIPEPTLDKVLKYHVIAEANILAASLPSAQTSQTTLLGQTFTIGTSGGAKIIDFGSRSSNITSVDVQCENGVIHVIDKVLLPNLSE